MSEFKLSCHAELRSAQRNLRPEGRDMVLKYGTPGAGDAYLMRRADADHLVARLKHEIQQIKLSRLPPRVRQILVAALKRKIRQIERLTNFKVVMVGGNVVTIYRSRPADQRRMLRGGKARRMRRSKRLGWRTRRR